MKTNTNTELSELVSLARLLPVSEREEIGWTVVAIATQGEEPRPRGLGELVKLSHGLLTKGSLRNREKAALAALKAAIGGVL